MEIAAEHAKSEHAAAGVKVGEGFLFDGVGLDGGDITPWHAQFAFFVKTNLADTALTGADLAAVGTGITFHRTIFQAFVEMAFVGQAV